MNEEEKEAINKTLKETIDIYEKYYSDNTEMLPQISEDYKMAKITLNYINKLQKELDKKDKVIDLMADYIYEHDISTTGLYEWRDNEQIKECFYKEAEEGND